MLRTLFFFILMIIYILIGLPVWLVMLFVLPFSRRTADRIAFFFVTFACRIGTRLCGITVEADGLENLPKKGETAVYVLNHRSIFDIVVFYPYVKDLTGFLAKQELGKIPFFSWWLLCAHCLFLDRKNIRKGARVIEKAVDNLNNGISMCVFPEGTRNKHRESRTSIAEFRAGSFKLATRTGLPVVPVTLYNTSAVFEDHMPKMTPARVKMTVHKPIRMEDLSEEEKRFLSRDVQTLMQKTMVSYEK